MLNLKPTEVSGVAYYDTRKDEIFTGLDEFGSAVDALRTDPVLQERFGGDEAERLALQFIYAMNAPAGGPGTFEERSSIVHGTRRISDYQADRARADQLQEIVRRILRGMIRLATTEPVPFSRRFFAEELDAALLEENGRRAVKAGLGLP